MIAVARATGKPLEWYLYGETPEAPARAAGSLINKEPVEPGGNISRERIHADVDRILDSGIPEYVNSLERAINEIRFQLMEDDLGPGMAELRSMKAKIERLITLQEAAEYRRRTRLPQTGEGAKQKTKRQTKSPK